MNRIKIVTFCQGRLPILKIFCENLSRLEPKPDVIICGSPDDGGCQQIVEKYGFQYVSHENLPCGLKANYCCEQAKGDYTHYMITGSDDLISQRIWSFYQTYQGDYAGLSDLYFYSTVLRKLIYWRGYKLKHANHGYPIGSCMLIAHSVMEKVNFRPYRDKSQWPEEHDLHRSIREFATVDLFPMSEVGISVDLKGGGITPFHLFPNSEYRPIEDLKVDMDVYNLLHAQ